MRVLVTGATGFVGRWLTSELASAGHEPEGTPESSMLDVRDEAALAAFVSARSPDAIVHLAGMALASDARADPTLAFEVNEGGARAVVRASVLRDRCVPILVAGSSEVYGSPNSNDLPLREDAPIRAEEPYGRSKVAQERAALDESAALGVPVVVARPFNHTGPGQRPEFVAPALARRVLAGRLARTTDISVGNLDVRRDLGDVRDTVRAYRLLIEGLADGRIKPGIVANVATGSTVSIRELLELIGEAVGIAPRPVVDPDLVRPNDPPLVVGDASRLRSLTGWAPEIPLVRTVADLVASIEAGDSPG